MSVAWIEAGSGWVGVGDGTIRSVAVAVECLVFGGFEQWVDTEKLADGGVVFSGADVGETGGLVGGLAKKGLVVGPGAGGVASGGAEGGGVALGKSLCGVCGDGG